MIFTCENCDHVNEVKLNATKDVRIMTEVNAFNCKPELKLELFEDFKNMGTNRHDRRFVHLLLVHAQMLNEDTPTEQVLLAIKQNDNVPVYLKNSIVNYLKKYHVKFQN